MVMHRLGLCVGVLAAGLFSASPLLTAADDGHESTTRLMVVSISLPNGGNLLAADELPGPVAKLLGEGWQISQTTMIDKNSDGTRANVLLTLTEPRVTFTNNHLRFPGFPGGMPGMPEMHFDTDATSVPGAGTPQSPADKGTLVVHWRDGGTSTIVIGDAQGVRSQAHVSTKDSHGAPAADYDATAFKDRKGEIEVDGRGAPLGKNSTGYSPDSFLVHADGHIDIQDDGGTHDSGVLDGSKAQNEPSQLAPGPSSPPTNPPGKGERQL